MCRMLFSVDQRLYAFETRSVRLGGHATSIRLESAFWRILEEIAAEQRVSLGKLLTRVHDEVLEFDEELSNFASLLRCACLNWRRVEDAPIKRAALAAQARHDFAMVK